MIFGRPKRTDFGALRGPFWEAPKIKIFIFWGSQKAPPRGPRRTPPSEKKGLALEAFDVFFGNLQLGRSRGEGAWAPQKSPWKIILALFWGPKLGPSGVPKCQENEVGKNRKNEIFEKFRGMGVLQDFSAGGWGFPLRSLREQVSKSLREQARKPGQKHYDHSTTCPRHGGGFFNYT